MSGHVLDPIVAAETAEAGCGKGADLIVRDLVADAGDRRRLGVERRARRVRRRVPSESAGNAAALVARSRLYVDLEDRPSSKPATSS
jgi:hypothetical protein